MNKYLPGIIIFCLLVILSLFTYSDYGVSWDEPIQREMGEVSYNYAMYGDRTLDKYIERDHGTAWEVPLIFFERWLGLTDSRDIYLMRHLASHLLFLVSCFAGYMLALRLFRNQFIACLGLLLFALHPRIYVHSYINTKDLPFLAMFLVSLSAVQYAFQKDKKWLYLLAGLACGYTTGIRILGVVLVCIVLAILLLDLLVAIYKKEKPAARLGNFALYLAGFCLMLFISFPSLWAQPFFSFANVFISLSHFRWEGYVLFNGETLLGSQLPWTYLPVWFIITTPVLWLLAGFTGICLVVIAFVKAPLKWLANTPERNFLIYIACFLLPVLMIILLHSVVYDDWRHVYFIYPPFVLLSLYAVDKLYKGIGRKVVPAVFVLQFIILGAFVLPTHPYNNVYFNELVSHKEQSLKSKYDLDYWGTSYHEGMKHVLKNDKRQKITIVTNHERLTQNIILFLPTAERQRVQQAGEKEADYFITNFRVSAEDFQGWEAIYEKKAANSTIMRVYKRR